MKRFGFLLAVCLGRWLSVTANAADSRPNFLFIYTDDQRWDAMGCVQKEQGERARFPWLQTPNMDRIAAEGVRFRNAFVVNSLCAPSRATFLTGCYGHRNGIVNNHTPFPTNNVTHATLLRAAGYTTGYIGKWHMGSQSGQRPGFDYSASFIGQGKYFDCPVEVNGVSQPTHGWVDDVSTDFAVEFIRRNKDKPFSLVVGYKATHGPFTPPDRAKDRFADAVARPVPNLATPAVYRTDLNPKHPGVAGDSDKIRNYFRCISAADDNVGRLLAVLDELELADNTVVVFASDNGYYLGEHGLGDKRSAYDESLRIPLLLRYPKSGVKNKVMDEIVLNVDLAPTFVDLAGVAVPKEMHGRSWKPLLVGTPRRSVRAAEDTGGRLGEPSLPAWRHAFFYCYFFERGFNIPSVTAVRTDTAKLIKYPGHDEWTELFDLKNDPYEMKNLARDATHKELLEQLQTEYDRQAKAIDFQVPSYADTPPAPEQPTASGVVLEHDFTKKPRRFDGTNCIEVPKSPRLNPAVAAWTIEIKFKADKPTGVLVAHGGHSNGYCLALDDGKPVFVLNAENKSTRVTGTKPVTGEWTTIKAGYDTKTLSMSVNSEPAITVPLKAALTKEPNDSLQIGADLRSQVIEPALPKFTGLIESVRIVSGKSFQ